MIQITDLPKITCRVDCEPINIEQMNLIAASPFIKDGNILKRVVMRAAYKGPDGVEFIVHNQYMEDSFVRPDGTIDAVGAKQHYLHGEYTTDYEKAIEVFTYRVKEMAPALMGVAVAQL